jgi:hypothetical protein
MMDPGDQRYETSSGERADERVEQLVNGPRTSLTITEGPTGTNREPIASGYGCAAALIVSLSVSIHSGAVLSRMPLRTRQLAKM